jgi:hypothetical protein
MENEKGAIINIKEQLASNGYTADATGQYMIRRQTY